MKKFLAGLMALMFAGVAGAASEPKPSPKRMFTETCAPQVDAMEHLGLRDPVQRAAFVRIFDLSLWYAGKEKGAGYRVSMPSPQRINDALESDRKQVDVTGKSPQVLAIYREIRDTRMDCQ